jgi:uncharacterized damage-inducible protein DinB
VGNDIIHRMTADYIQTVIDYNYWARDRVLASAEQLSPEQLSQNLGSSFSSVLDTLVHMHSAEWLWFHRWKGESPIIGADRKAWEREHRQVHHLASVATIRDAWRPLESDIRAFVHALGSAGLGQAIEYKTVTGQPATAVYWQMIVHVVNHGTYHRGQVATMLRQLAGTPAQSTDMIVFFSDQATAPRQAVLSPARPQ